MILSKFLLYQTCEALLSHFQIATITMQNAQLTPSPLTPIANQLETDD